METGQQLEEGAKLGKYTVVRLLGRGGMGQVYLATGPDGGRYAAKIMRPPEGDAPDDWRRRFAREAKFARTVRHKNLIAIHDAGETSDGRFSYIIMDYMPGGSLADRLTSHGRLDIRKAVDIVVQIATALEVAHKAGIVHRDIKPDNILFDADGTPKLSDLGIAKFSECNETTTTITKTGMIIGTPSYMSPEQMMDSHSVDARADIYSLGIVLYEMLTGVRPYSGSTIVELLSKALSGEELPDIREQRPEVSAALAYVLAKMVASKPENRITVATEVAELLGKAKAGQLKIPKEYRRSKASDQARRRMLRMLKIGLLIAITSLLPLLLWRYARMGMQPVPMGVDSLTQEDGEQIALQAITALQSSKHIRPKKENTRIVVKVLPVDMPRLPGDKRTDEVAALLGGLIREELTKSGRFIVYNNDVPDSGPMIVSPDYILKTKLLHTVHDTDGGRASMMEFHLQLTMVDAHYGLEVFQKRVPLMKCF